MRLQIVAQTLKHGPITSDYGPINPQSITRETRGDVLCQ
jgi:hypothetical protein